MPRSSATVCFIHMLAWPFAWKSKYLSHFLPSENSPQCFSREIIYIEDVIWSSLKLKIALRFSSCFLHQPQSIILPSFPSKSEHFLRLRNIRQLFLNCEEYFLRHKADNQTSECDWKIADPSLKLHRVRGFCFQCFSPRVICGSGAFRRGLLSHPFFQGNQNVFILAFPLLFFQLASGIRTRGPFPLFLAEQS